MDTKKMTNFGAVTSIVSSTLGSGITLMVLVFMNLGTTIASTLMICVGMLTFFSIYSLSYVSTLTKENEKEKQSYSGIAAKFSKKLQQAVSISLVVSSLVTSFSFTQTFLKIFLKTLKYIGFFNELLDEEKNPNYLFIARIIVLATICSLYYFLFQLDNLASLAPFSRLSLFTAILFSATLSFYGLTNPIVEEEVAKDPNAKFNLVNPLGAIIFALHCQFSYLDIFNCMKDDSLSNARNVTGIASIIATILYGSVGFLGFKALGRSVGDDPLIFKFSSADSPIIASLTERFGFYLGTCLPMLIHSLFCPIFFGGTIFNNFAIIPELQNMLSFKNKLISRSSVALILCLFLFSTSIKEFTGLGDVFAIAGFLLTTPLSFLFPAIFVLYTSSKVNLMTVGSGIVVVISFAIMIGLTLLQLNVISL